MLPILFDVFPNKRPAPSVSGMSRRVVYQVMKIRTLLILLVLAATAGCEGNRTTPPTGPTMTPGPTPHAPVPTVTVRVEGRIIGERDEPVPGAVVAATDFCAGDCASVPGTPAVSQGADDQGVFVLMVNLPSNWSQVNVQVTRDGFEPTRSFVPSTEAASAVLRLLPIVTIRPGKSIETRLFLGTFFCGDESWICRRIVVESAAGESMDLEVIPRDGQEVGLIVGPESTHPISPSPPRRVTMSSGEVWLYGSVGRVTVRAHRR